MEAKTITLAQGDDIRVAVRDAVLRGGGVIHLPPGDYPMEPGRIEPVIVEHQVAEIKDGEPVITPIRRVIRIFCDGINWYTMDEYGPQVGTDHKELMKPVIPGLVKREDSLIFLDIE